MKLWLLFALGTILCWGAYGPSIHQGQTNFPKVGDRSINGLKALLCVGGAYFLVGVLVPSAVLALNGNLNNFPMKATLISTLAGILGALGAVCIIWSIKNDGSPVVIMPLVFSGATLVNAVVSTIMHPPEKGLLSTSPLFYVGVALAAGGAYMILKFKPA